MKLNRLWVILAITAGIASVGCNKSGKLNEPSTAPAPSGPVELKLKWTPNEKILQTMDMKMQNEIAMPNQPSPTKQDMEMAQDYGMTVISALPDGGHEVELDFIGARMKMSMGGKEMLDYDSAKKSDKPNPMTDTFGKIVGAKLKYILDASNHVERLEGMDEMINKMAGSNPAEGAMLKGMFNEGSFKQLMSQALFLPAKPVQPGDTWPVKIDMPAGPIGNLTMNYTVTFDKWETHGKRNCARLNYDGTMTSTEGPKTNSNPFKISSLDGALTGTSWFDPELGIMVDNALHQDMTMVMTMNMGGEQRITNHMVQDITVKLTSLK